MLQLEETRSWNSTSRNCKAISYLKFDTSQTYPKITVFFRKKKNGYDKVEEIFFTHEMNTCFCLP